MGSKVVVRNGSVRESPLPTFLGGSSVRDIFSRIERDHRKIIGILDALESEAEAEHPESVRESMSRRRRKLAQQLVIEESRHEAAEEMHLWPAVRETVDGGRALSESGIRQEAKAKRLLHRLDKAASVVRDGDAGEVEELLPHVGAALREHIAYEESKVLPRVRLALGEADASRLGLAYEHSKSSGPTRPHPMTPSLPGVLKTVGRAAAAMDTARDVLTRRGR